LSAGGTAKFGEPCASSNDCVAGFSFICAGNTCVQCVQNSQCASGQNCNDGVCVSSGGNASGQLCASNDQCLSKYCDGNTNTCRGGGSTTTNKTSGDNPLGNFPGENLSAQDVTGIVIGFACWLSFCLVLNLCQPAATRRSINRQKITLKQSCLAFWLFSGSML